MDRRIGYYLMGDNSQGIISRFKTYMLHKNARITVTLSLSSVSEPIGRPNTIYWQGRHRTEWSDLVDDGMESPIWYEEVFENGVY